MKVIYLTSVYCISSLLKICDSSVRETDFQWDVTSANESSSQQCIVWMNHSGQFYELDKLIHRNKFDFEQIIHLLIGLRCCFCGEHLFSFCVPDKKLSYTGFVITWVWGYDDRSFIFSWTFTLRRIYCHDETRYTESGNMARWKVLGREVKQDCITSF